MNEHTPAQTPARAPLDPQLAYTATDVAEFLKISTKTVYALMRAGQLPARRLGQLRGWRIMGSAVYAFMSAPDERD